MGNRGRKACMKEGFHSAVKEAVKACAKVWEIEVERSAR